MDLDNVSINIQTIATRLAAIMPIRNYTKLLPAEFRELHMHMNVRMHIAWKLNQHSPQQQLRSLVFIFSLSNSGKLGYPAVTERGGDSRISQ